MEADKRFGQNKKMKKKFLITILSLFAFISAVFFAMKCYAPMNGFHFVALEAGNAIMALLSLVTYSLITKQLDKSPQAFVRGVSGSSFLKLMVCMISILVYILLNRSSIHKPTVFVLFGIYAVYTAAETWLLSKLARE